MSVQADQSGQADSGWDDYNERVLRNEGRLGGLEQLVSETREADRKLIEQRSDSLARELERRAEALVTLSIANREADLREARDALAAHVYHVERIRESDKEHQEQALQLQREVLDTAISENYKQSREAIAALEERSAGERNRVEQMVRQWRDSDREARDLFSDELKEHLDRLNHANERQVKFQQNSVTRELWQSEKDAQITRESVIRESIVSLDRVLLSMNPIEQADKAHREMQERQDAAIAAASQILETKIVTLSEKLAELKESRDNQAGRSSGYSALYGWGIAAVTALASIIIVADLVVR